jgi:hypothetical protein
MAVFLPARVESIVVGYRPMMFNIHEGRFVVTGFHDLGL